jgi:adenine-specific DNA-methyltransferase
MEEQFSSIDIFVPDEKAFKSIDQDAVTIIAAKGDHECKTTLHRVTSLAANEAQSSCTVSSSTAKSSSVAMKGFLLDSDTLELIHKLNQKIDRVSDYCDNAAGTVTAANDFFILSRSDVVRHKLKRWCRPIIKKSGFLEDTVDFTHDSFEAIESSGKACYLLDFSKLDAERLPKAVERYIAIGEEQELHLRYKCRHRTDWFKVPVVAQNEGFFFKRSHVVPRLCVNTHGVLATDSAYHIRMHPERSIRDLCGSFYNSFSLLFAEIEGRFYGGGVLELTPNEFRKLPLPLSEFSTKDFAAFQSKFTLSDRGEAAIRFSNRRLKLGLQLSCEDLTLLESARQVLQKHRLRHGSGI